MVTFFKTNTKREIEEPKFCKFQRFASKYLLSTWQIRTRREKNRPSRFEIRQKDLHFLREEIRYWDNEGQILHWVDNGEGRPIYHKFWTTGVVITDPSSKLN